MTFAYTESTNTVVATNGTSGTPLTFADFVTADRAGTAILLAATAGLSPTLALTYQVRPVEERALLITFNVASKTTETDYIFVTGTDWRDAAQTESIDVSAGNGAYVSTKYFRTITNIDCSDNSAGGGTQWADGTVEVTQPQWGVIWDQGQGQYQLCAYFEVGDGSTSTYFQDSAVQISFNGTVLNTNTTRITGTSGATFIGGELIHADDKTTKNGIAFYDYAVSPTLNHYIFDTTGTGVINLYSCSFWNQLGQGWIGLRNTGAHRFWNCLCSSQCYVVPKSPSTDIFNMTVLDSYVGISDPDELCTADRVFMGMKDTGRVVYGSQSFTASDIVAKNNTESFRSATNFDTPDIGYLDDCVFDTWDTNFNADATGVVFRRYSCNIKVTDEDGVALEGVTVDCEDVNTDAVWAAGTVLTDASGDIAAQKIQYQKFYYSGGQAVDTYSPHKLTLSKAGYETLVLENVTVDGPIKWHIALQDSHPVVGETLYDLKCNLYKLKTERLVMRI